MIMVVVIATLVLPARPPVAESHYMGTVPPATTGNKQDGNSEKRPNR